MSLIQESLRNTRHVSTSLRHRSCLAIEILVTNGPYTSLSSLYGAVGISPRQTLSCIRLYPATKNRSHDYLLAFAMATLLTTQLACNAQEDCPICQEPLNDPTITICKHTFCKSCLASWLSHGTTCPLCRHQLHSTPTVGSRSNAVGDIWPDAAYMDYSERQLRPMPRTPRWPAEQVLRGLSLEVTPLWCTIIYWLLILLVLISMAQDGRIWYFCMTLALVIGIEGLLKLAESQTLQETQ